MILKPVCVCVCVGGGAIYDCYVALDNGQRVYMYHGND